MEKVNIEKMKEALETYKNNKEEAKPLSVSMKEFSIWFKDKGNS